MFSISVVVGRAQPMVWSLLFRDENNALAALGRLRDVGDIDVADEFGQRLLAKGGDLGPILFENLNESKQAHITRALHEARLRHSAQQAAMADPMLKTAMLDRGPSILTPMGMNGRG